MADGWMFHKDVWIAAGGTAGHLLPALGVAEVLADMGIDRAQIGFIGSNRPLEAELIGPYSYELLHLDTAGLSRNFTIANLAAGARLIFAAIKLMAAALHDRPKVVVGFGGYFSVPPLLAAKLLGVPVVVVETNSVAGRANRLLARIANRVFAAENIEGIGSPEVVGVPLRPEISASQNFDSGEFRKDHNIAENAQLVTIFGGSLGAEKINRAVITMLETLDGSGTGFDGEICFYHVIGRRDFRLFEASAAALSKRPGRQRYIFQEFDTNVYRAISASTLVVCRAGSGTIAELGYFKKPSILIPLPNAPGDHQRKNAEVLERAGAASVIYDSELSSESLQRQLSVLLADTEALERMSKAAGETFNGNGCGRIAEVLFQLIKGER